MSSFYKYIPESLLLFAVALPVYIPPSVVISHLPSVFVLHLYLICPLQHCFPITGFPVSKFTTFHIPIIQKYGMISAEARTIQTILFHNCLERKKNIFKLERAEIRVREKLQLMCKRTNVACYSEGDCGLQSPGSRASSTF